MDTDTTPADNTTNLARVAFIAARQTIEQYKLNDPRITRSKSKAVLAVYSDPTSTIKQYARLDRGVLRLMNDVKWATKFGFPKDRFEPGALAYMSGLQRAGIIAGEGKGLKPVFAELQPLS